MDFKDQLKVLSERVEKLLPQIQTEEATKNALIMPFIQILGYDVFNPFEVNPEYIADIGIKKGEKVDYAIMKDGEPIILVECKCHNELLDPYNSQLFRYFHTTKAKFGVLTNGLNYRFYTDLVETNKMDERAFFEFNLTDLRDNVIDELKKFHKSYFNLEQILNSASELKYTNELKSILIKEIAAPTENFVRFFAKQIYPGVVTAKVMDQFTLVTKKSLNQLFNEMVNDRLKSALNKENEENKITEQQIESVSHIIEEKKIVTTELELEAFFIVKSLLRGKIDLLRLGYKDTASYLAIQLDNNVRRQICRFWLNTEKKYIGLFDENKKEIRHEISSLDDVYKYANDLIEAATKIASGTEKTKSEAIGKK
jgi:hypothetical protein